MKMFVFSRDVTVARKKKMKLQSASVGDCIHEHSVTTKCASGKVGHLSIRSLTSDNNGDLMPPNPTQAPLSPAQIKGRCPHFLLVKLFRGMLCFVVVQVTTTCRRRSVAAVRFRRAVTHPTAAAAHRDSTSTVPSTSTPPPPPRTCSPPRAPAVTAVTSARRARSGCT